MERPEVSDEENIVRAIHQAWWDMNEGRRSSSVFKGTNISVSRLSILALESLFLIFHDQLDSSPNGIIVGAGEINVGRLREIGNEFANNVSIKVIEAPLENNPAHAEVPQKISRGLANKIISELQFHSDGSMRIEQTKEPR